MEIIKFFSDIVILYEKDQLKSKSNRCIRTFDDIFNVNSTFDLLI